MAHNLPLYEKQQQGDHTDCSFVFQVHDGESSEVKTIQAHKLILSAASPFFEAHFKSEWKGNEPIPISVCEHSVFKKLIKAIYLGEIVFETLDDGCRLYEAAHFYQIEVVLDLLRLKIPKLCIYEGPLEISSLVNTAFKYQDYKLMQFSTKYFTINAESFLQDEDSLKFSFEAINFLYQYNDISANEDCLLDTLEEIVRIRGPQSIKVLKPAIGTIRFRSLPQQLVIETELLSETEKDFLLKKNTLNFFHLSLNETARKVKPFFLLFSLETQQELRLKYSFTKCWVCRADHNIFRCIKARSKHEFYRNFRTTPFFSELSEDSDFERYCFNDVPRILKEMQKYAYDPAFSYFAKIDDEINNIYSV